MTNVHIWRQDIVLVERQTITAPGLRRILAVDNQRDKLEVWFEVVPGQPERPIDLIIVGTGHAIPDAAGDYIGHLIANGGTFVWHFYTGRIYQGGPR